MKWLGIIVLLFIPGKTHTAATTGTATATMPGPTTLPVVTTTMVTPQKPASPVTGVIRKLPIVSSLPQRPTPSAQMVQALMAAKLRALATFTTTTTMAVTKPPTVRPSPTVPASSSLPAPVIVQSGKRQVPTVETLPRRPLPSITITTPAAKITTMVSTTTTPAVTTTTSSMSVDIMPMKEQYPDDIHFGDHAGCLIQPTTEPPTTEPPVIEFPFVTPLSLEDIDYPTIDVVAVNDFK